jgi:hypothetical protein
MAQPLRPCRPLTGLALAVSGERAVAPEDDEPCPLADRQETALRPPISPGVSNIEYVAGRSRFGVLREHRALSA